MKELQKQALVRFDFMYEPWPVSPFWKKDVNAVVESRNKDVASMRENLSRELLIAYQAGKDAAVELIEKRIGSIDRNDTQYPMYEIHVENLAALLSEARLPD